MNYDPMTPIWAQVLRAMKEEIVTGKLKPGDKLPSGRELAVQYTINPNTAARVYQEMEAEGLCEVRRGLGTFVTLQNGRLENLRETMADDILETCVKEMARLGYSRKDIVQRLERTKEDA